MLAELSAKAEPVRQLAYRLYTLCERQGWADDACGFNDLITSWTGIETATVNVTERPTQRTFDEMPKGDRS